MSDAAISLALPTGKDSYREFKERWPELLLEEAADFNGFIEAVDRRLVKLREDGSVCLLPLTVEAYEKLCDKKGLDSTKIESLEEYTRDMASRFTISWLTQEELSYRQWLLRYRPAAVESMSEEQLRYFAELNRLILDFTDSLPLGTVGVLALHAPTSLLNEKVHLGFFRRDSGMLWTDSAFPALFEKLASFMLSGELAFVYGQGDRKRAFWKVEGLELAAADIARAPDFGDKFIRSLPEGTHLLNLANGQTASFTRGRSLSDQALMLTLALDVYGFINKTISVTVSAKLVTPFEDQVYFGLRSWILDRREFKPMDARTSKKIVETLETGSRFTAVKDQVLILDAWSIPLNG